MFTKLKTIFTPRPKPTDWQRRFTEFKRSLAMRPHDDPFWLTLLDLLDEYVAIETAELCKADVPTEELHRARGRISMLLDLKNDFAALPDKARAELEETARKNAPPVPGAAEQMT